MKPYFITTPIFYVNAGPHIGHLYSLVIADAARRWQQLRHGAKVIFSTGTDEHGSKIQQIEADRTRIDAHCDRISSQYRELCSHFDVNYTHFIRTTDEHHAVSVKRFWNKLKDNGHIYSSTYEGWYCVSDETFVPESQVSQSGEDGRMMSNESGHTVEWTKEQNYLFRLTHFQQDLTAWISQSEHTVRPKKFHKILYDLITREEFKDISISRPASRVHWGIPVPHDSSQTVYVWFDALVNYLTAAGYFDCEDKSCEKMRQHWPPVLQVLGKDILKFHGIYWPAFLMAADLEPPRGLFCHSHWTVNDEKMSKSKGNVICPDEYRHKYTADGLRYFLLREGVAHSDGNISELKITRLLNSELADTLGNLFNRCCGKSINPLQCYPQQIDELAYMRIASHSVTRQLIEMVETLSDTCERHYNDLNFHKVATTVMDCLRQLNVFFETMQPWRRLVNGNADGQQHDIECIIYLTCETLRISAILLGPIIPTLSTRLLDMLAVELPLRTFSKCHIQPNWHKSQRHDENSQLCSQEAGRILTKSVLFNRILVQSSKTARTAATA